MKNQKLIFTLITLGSCVTASAQNYDADNLIKGITSKLISLGEPTVDLGFVLIGILSVFEGIYAYIKQTKGDPQSKEAMIAIIGTLALAFIFLTVVKFTIFRG